MSGYVVGIDLGTSNTVAVIRSPDGRRRPVLFDGAPLMPSSVFLTDNGQLAVGRDAQRLAQLDPGRYEPNPKRRIDESSVLLGSSEIPTVHMLAAVLRAVAVGVAEVTRYAPPVVLTYPASWGQTRRKALHDAAITAGFNDVSMLPEPVAAARYFISALNHPLPPGQAVVVYDFGGGTIDIAVVRNDPEGFTVIGSGGLEDVGGLDLDAALVERLGEVLAASQPEVWKRLQDPRTAQERRDRRLFWEDIRGAKEMLSRTTVAPVSVPGVESALHLTRDELEQKIGPMIARTVAETARVVRDCGLTANGLAGILLVGGSSRVPLVARMLHRELGVVPTVLEQPELPVAEGAVVHPSELTNDGRLAVATGTASVPVSAPPSGTQSMIYPVSGVPMSAVPMSGPPASAPPVSGPPMPVSAAPVSPAVNYTPPPPPQPPVMNPPKKSRRAALIAGVGAAVLLLAGGAFALKAYNDNKTTPTDKPSQVAQIGQWKDVTKIPGSYTIEGAGAAVVKDQLYVIGGYTGEAPRTQIDNVTIYDLNRGSWTNGPKLPKPLSHMAVVQDANLSIWVLGGWETSGASKKTWQLKLGATAWEEGPDLPEARQDGAAVEDSKGLVFAGGTGPDGTPKSDIYALGTTGWTTIGQLSVARGKLSAATDRATTIWFIGGRSQDGDTTNTYDTIDRLINRKPDKNANIKLDTPREAPSAVWISGIGLCALGGNKGSKVYDWWCENADNTAKLPKQVLPRAGMAVANVGGVIYTVGGYNGEKSINGTSTVESFQYTK
ncbi:Hsp70 family protein [Dactylosporangium sp. NPDC051541]|uniref:Hsp70 family protein n=1 Tax=Dactylosporangium sp. NPDC051541 TaxID=3363977 RepID=UPI0037881E64